MDPQKEQAHLQLLSEMAAEMATALDALKGKPASGPNLYLFPMSQGLCLVAHGFITLKRAGNEHGARVLIRTAIETTLKLAAVYEEPITLYRIAYSEFLEDGKFLNAADVNHVVVDSAIHAAKWEKESKVLAKLFPGQRLADREISTFELARVGKMPYLYDFYYRLYCNYTHATLRAHANPEHIIPEVDYAAVEHALLFALVVGVDRIGVSCPNIATYKSRIEALGPHPETKPSR